MTDLGGPAEAGGREYRYPSLASLRAAHVELLKRYREEGDAGELLSEIEDLVRSGRETGALLDEDDDREDAQSLLDYWVTVLYRADREPPYSVLSDFDPAQAPELDEANCPYLGLDPFQEDDYRIFFGRRHLVADMLEVLQRSRLLAVVGPSGSGKSSSVRAGLLPALKARAASEGREWRFYPPMVPGSNPLENLARLLRPGEVSADEWNAAQVEGLRQNALYLTQLVDELGDKSVILVVDQFEETFTLCTDDTVRQSFIDNLSNLVQRPDAESRVILTMRTDFESYVDRLPVFRPLFRASTVRVTSLSAGELREAIVGPAATVGLRFESGVVDALIQDILGEPAALPLLQFTLLKLWENRERDRVTWEAYRRLGGGRLALARSADECYETLIPEEQVTARRLLLRMVRPGVGLEVTSRRIRREALYQVGEAPGRIDRVLDKLVQARLVRLSEGDTPQDAQVEVAHEALVRNWPRLVEWLEQDRVAMNVRLRLEAKAAEWERLGRGSGALLDEVELREAEQWLESADAAYLGYDETLPELVAASRVALEEAAREKEAVRQRELDQARALAAAERRRAEEQARAARRFRYLSAGLILLLAVAVVAAVSAFVFQSAAVDAQANAADAATRADSALLAANVASSTAGAARATADAALSTAGAAQATADAGMATAVAAQSAAEVGYRVALTRRAEAIAVLSTVAAAEKLAVERQASLLTLAVGSERLLTAQASRESMPRRTPTQVAIGTPRPTPRPDLPTTDPVQVLQEELAKVRAAQTVEARQTVVARATSVTNCPFEPRGKLEDLWNVASYKSRLGCPVQEQPLGGPFAEQYFEHGFMLWSEQAGHLYLAIVDDQTFRKGTWYTSRSEPVTWPYIRGLNCTPTPPAPGLQVPVSGFGGLWCNREDIRKALGFATAKEYSADRNLLQEFDGGYILLDSRGNRYILFADDGSYVVEDTESMS
jgi:hypothetical protein